MQWVATMGVSVLVAIAVGGLVWFGWALAHNLIVLIKLRMGKQDNGEQAAEADAAVDAEVAS